MSDPVKKDETYSYQDYLSWPENERWELINGKAYGMSPAPTFIHQKLVLFIANQISNQLKGKKCQAMVAPLDVKLTEKSPGKEDLVHVVQPDVLVFCNPEIADEKGLNGAPDWILEVLSDSTAWKDTTEKLKLYEKFGVQEYWILNPQTNLLMVYLLREGAYGVPAVYLGSVKVPVTVLPGVVVEIF